MFLLARYWYTYFLKEISVAHALCYLNAEIIPQIRPFQSTPTPKQPPYISETKIPSEIIYHFIKNVAQGLRPYKCRSNDWFKGKSK